MAPADTVIYLSLAVRPQGAQARQINQTLQKLGGGGAEQQLRRAVAKLLRKTGANYSGNVKPWLGQRLGIVFTQPPSPGQGGANAGVALIAPTSNPSAARSFVHQLIRHNPHTQGEVSGGYAVVGGALAYQAILATTPANSLATTAGYRNTTGQLPAAPAALLYLNLNRYAKLARASATGALGATNAFAGVFKRSLSRFGPNAAVAAGVSLTPSAIRLDTVQVGVRRPAHSVSANVGQLPAGSWLAAAFGSLGAGSQKQLQTGFQIGLLGALHTAAASNPLAGAMTQRLAFVQHDVLPALGPLSLAVGGTSPLNLSVGLKLTPDSIRAAGRLLGLLHNLLAGKPALVVKGSARHFTAQLPTGSALQVDELHRSVVATYGFPSQSAFLSPTSKLSSDPSFRQAEAQLPSPTTVPLYLSFAPIAALVQLTDHKPSAAKTVRVLDKLSYLILGGSPGHSRLVIGLR